MRPFVFDALVILGVTVMTLGVIGIFRMPDIYTKVHAASKSVFLGAIVLAIAGMVVSDLPVTARLVLICLGVAFTTTLSSHVIGRAAFMRHMPMESEGAIDESGSLRPAPEHVPPWRV
jgi:multicomponent Na+:H+ antiporter subunit G